MKQTVIPEIPVPLPGIVWFEPNPPPHTSPKNTLKALWKFQFRFKLPNNDPAFYLSPPPTPVGNFIKSPSVGNVYGYFLDTQNTQRK